MVVAMVQQKQQQLVSSERPPCVKRFSFPKWLVYGGSFLLSEFFSSEC
jgi:hypothetical protein